MRRDALAGAPTGIPPNTTPALQQPPSHSTPPGLQRNAPPIRIIVSDQATRLAASPAASPPQPPACCA
eukprot:scaffold1053_cov107-Isochrysis_galbana.AAC.14